MDNRRWRQLYWGTVLLLLLAFAVLQLRTGKEGQPAAPAARPATPPAAITDTAGPAASDIPLPPLDGELY